MPRLARQDLLYEGCYAHIISRSIRKLKILKDQDDFRAFLNLLEKTKREAGYKLYHYCLMQTHFHLVVSMPAIERFSTAIQYLKGQYACYVHKKYRLSGPIWSERYRALLIEDEAYMKACGEYVENNPVKARLVKSAEEWKNSSFRHYNGKELNPLIDQYEGGGKEIDIEFEGDEFFENGKVIGSAFFQFQGRQGRDQSLNGACCTSSLIR
jgi:putative transposase